MAHFQPSLRSSVVKQTRPHVQGLPCPHLKKSLGFFTRVQWTNGGDDIGTTNQWDPLVESWLDVKCALVHYSRDPVDPLTVEGGLLSFYVFFELS